MSESGEGVELPFGDLFRQFALLLLPSYRSAERFLYSANRIQQSQHFSLIAGSTPTTVHYSNELFKAVFGVLLYN